MELAPSSFMSDYGVRFVLTEANNEDMEGFNDIWANILNGDILNNSEYISEHPSIAPNNKKFDDAKGVTPQANQMLLDISAITNNENNLTIKLTEVSASASA